MFVPQLNIVELAREGGRWNGSVEVAAFGRLGEVLSRATDAPNADTLVVDAALDFALDDEGRPWVQGTCKVVAPICCGRCAETVDVEVESRLDFRVVSNDTEAQGLMPTLDVVVSEVASVPLTALVEDDILLSLPETGCADGTTCVHAVDAVAPEACREASAANPFGVLRTLVEGREPV